MAPGNEALFSSGVHGIQQDRGQKEADILYAALCGEHDTCNEMQEELVEFVMLDGEIVHSRWRYNRNSN